MKDEKKYFNFDQQPGVTLSNRKIINDGEPLISIVTPYYNANKYIEQTANSIFNQTFPYWEWIIINDGSTNTDTDTVLSELKSKDDRIKVLNQENAGPAAARYFGVKEAKADVIFTIDADDLIDNTMLECGYFTLLTNPEAAWAYTSICTFGKDNYLYNPKFDTLFEKKENLISVASFIRKDKFLEVKSYEHLPKEVHEDWYMWLSFLIKGYKPIRMNFYGFWYRRLDSGRLKSISEDKEKAKIAETYLHDLKKQVKSRVGAIQFPISSYYDYDTYPNDFDIAKKPINIKGEKRRILFMFPWTVTGGADIFNLNLIKALREKGYEITIVTTEPNEYILRPEFEKYVDEYFDLTTFLKRKEWAGFISHLIKSRNIDIVFESNSFYGYYATPWLKSKYPEVIFVDYLHAEDWSWRDGSYPRDSIAISKFLDKTYTCTKYLKDLMCEKMGRKVDNTEVVYIGTDSEYFDPNTIYENEKELKEKYFNKKVILFPCRLEYLKRPILAIKLLNEICKIRKDIVLVVVGDGPAKKETLSYAKEYALSEYVDFVGMKSDVRPYYKIADVTLICSLTEGLTLTAYESMSMGTPVVSADVGGQKELVDNECGRIVKKYQDLQKDLHNFDYSKDELDEYTTAILEIVDSKDYEKISYMCRDKVKKHFSIQNMIDDLLSSFENLMKNGTTVDKSLCNNIELAERYLIVFNEYHKTYHENPDEIVRKATTSQILWRYRFWRVLIKVLKKLKVIQSVKKYILRTDKQLIK